MPSIALPSSKSFLAFSSQPDNFCGFISHAGTTPKLSNNCPIRPVEAMMGSFVPISALLFCLTLTATQAWLARRRCDRTSHIWIGTSLLGLITAILGAIATGLLAITLFQLDVLQNGQHGAIASVAMVATFGVIMALLQWLILRQKVNAPFLQAFFNVTFGTAIWLFLASQIFNYENTVMGLPLFVVLSVILGMALGSIIHTALNR
jgi:hypothetical protein